MTAATGDDCRLVWATTTNAHLDGAWWPRTRDAAREVTDPLAMAGEHLGGPVTRVSLSMDSWSADRPRRLLNGDRLVRLGWFRTLDPDTVTVGRGTHERVRLLVVPCDVDEGQGASLMQRLATTQPWPELPAAALATVTASP
jgi:hypothetical protein